jgi:hypothetical protein
MFENVNEVFMQKKVNIFTNAAFEVFWGRIQIHDFP